MIYDFSPDLNVDNKFLHFFKFTFRSRRSSKTVVLNRWVAGTYFWVAKHYVIGTMIVIYGSQNSVLLYFVGRQLPNVENPCSKMIYVGGDMMFYALTLN